jgi:hypothetical protein
VGREWRHLALLVAILVLFVVTPMVALVPHGVLVLHAFAALVLAAGSYALLRQRTLFLIAIASSAITVAATALLLFTQQWWAAVLSHACVVVLIAFFSISILDYVLRGGRITVDRIFAAVCVYLLIGYAWTFGYALVETVEPGSFRATGQPGSAIELGNYVSQVLEMRYFSFVTLTTVGYGDIAPVSSAARTLAALEAITGQIYLTVLVARLVGLHIVHSNAEKS